MITYRGKVQYLDGETAEFTGGTAALAAYEEYAIRNNLPYGEATPSTLGALVIAHFCLGIEEGFKPWRARVHGIELEVESVPPTQPEASDA